jgi:glutathione synthase/RimK-type ligase-like ATP-grasp enzyme
MKCINERGWVSELVIWNDPQVNWQQYEKVFLHTAWDYILHVDGFCRWIQQLSSDVSFINPTELILWNMDKRYLFDLKEKGINLPYTLTFDSGLELLERKNQYPVVVKKVVSAGGRGNWLCHNPEELRTIVEQENLYQQPVLLQNYEPSIITKGEYSAVYLDEEYQFTILKLPKEGEFRVQSQYGGTEQLVKADKKIMNFTDSLLSALPSRSKYARVDFIVDEHDIAKLMEIELIEPDLFLRYHPASFQRFADLLK